MYTRKELKVILQQIFIWTAVSAVLCIIMGLNGVPVSPLLVTEEVNKYHDLKLCWSGDLMSHEHYLLVSRQLFDGKVLIRRFNEDPERAERFDLYYAGNGEIRIKDLLCNTRYYWMFIDCWKIGDKSYFIGRTETQKLVTAPFEPPEVYILKADEITDTEVSLHWNYPLNYYRNADGSLVQFAFEVIISGSEETGEYGSSETKSVIEDLKPFTVYNAGVRVNAVADGQNFSTLCLDLLSFRTLPHAPEEVKAEKKGTGNITVRWKKYEEGGYSVTYAVYGSKSKDGPFSRLSVTADSSYSESGLSPGTTRYYRVETHIESEGKEYVSPFSVTVSATTDKPVKYYGSSSYRPVGVNGSASGSKSAQARAVARQIARSIHGSSDWERIGQAAYIVSMYCRNGTYTTSGSDYSQAYGVFISGQYSCAGATRALGMVLEELGYSWSHAYANQWHHQWCIVTIDGKPGWADGQLGMIGYGTHP
ncbi:MAG: fibronectin type III domain-containing protein [Erysipelotrichaceae bacterium]|nr:fibronectin type III domain-containing protein [Erysipelotrichaceae bacterium]